MIFSEFMNVAASTKRKGLTSGFAVRLTDLKCTPLAPVSPETQLRMGLKTPVILWETFLEDGPDIKQGDKLVIDAVEYPIKSVATWTWPPENEILLHLIVEDLRN